MQTNYADTILNINVTGSMVRIDLGTVVQVPAREDGQADRQELRATQTQQLVMPLDGFVSAFNMQEAMIKKMLDDGVLQKKPAEPTLESEGAEKP